MIERCALPSTVTPQYDYKYVRWILACFTSFCSQKHFCHISDNDNRLPALLSAAANATTLGSLPTVIIALKTRMNHLAENSSTMIVAACRTNKRKNRRRAWGWKEWSKFQASYTSCTIWLCRCSYGCILFSSLTCMKECNNSTEEQAF